MAQAGGPLKKEKSRGEEKVEVKDRSRSMPTKEIMLMNAAAVSMENTEVACSTSQAKHSSKLAV